MSKVTHENSLHSFRVEERAVTPPVAPTYRMHALHALAKADMSSESEEKDTMF